MITIGVELNHVVRNINRQLLKYYQKEFDPSLDVDEIDDRVDVIGKYMKFRSKKEKSDFIYIDYPYEIFGCAGTSEKKLAVKITNWLVNVSNIEDEDIRIVFYSLNEEAIAIQSTFFFLSKIGARVRKVFFPKNVKEVWDECDVVITANNQMFEEEIPENKKIILINREFNEKNKDKAFLTYDNLSDVIDDNNFFNNFIHAEG
jgi:hypothetical protein